MRHAPGTSCVATEHVRSPDWPRQFPAGPAAPASHPHPPAAGASYMRGVSDPDIRHDTD